MARKRKGKSQTRCAVEFAQAGESSMTPPTLRESRDDDPRFPRRRFLEGMIATGAFVAVWPALAEQPTPLDAWEETDAACQVPLEPAQYDYELDPLLSAFIELSEILTGASNLDRHLASQYLERFAAHPQLTKALPLLIKAYQGITPGSRPSPDDVKRVIMNDKDASGAETPVALAAKQVIYVWYVSAFFLPRSDTERPPVRVWFYGTPEQYSRALLWSVIQAHAPMTPGGPPDHWANAPAT
jgi:Membrane bound FAD containing D-sorbitol dehydrogenase